MEPALGARLVSAKAKAAILAGAYAEAETYSLRALSLGDVTPEPLIRLYLLKKRPDSARDTLLEHGHKLDSQERDLLSRLLLKSGAGIPAEAPTKVTHHLYRGLLLAQENRLQESEMELDQFLVEAEWGWDLASPTKLGSTESLCSACVRNEAKHLYQSFTVCLTCLKKLQNPSWNRQCLAEPTEEQVEIFLRLYGQNLEEFVEELRKMDTSTRGAQSALIPVQSLEELLSQLEPRVRKHCEQVGVKGESPSALTIVSQLYAAANEECRAAGHEHPPPYPEEPEGFDGLESIDWEWVLNLANWCNKLQPPYGEKAISGRDLLTAIDSVRGENFIRLHALALLGSGKMADEQVPYFEGLLEQHPDDLFLHAILAEDRTKDWDSQSAQRRLRHRLWLIQQCPELAKYHSLHGIDPQMDLELVKAWVEKLLANPNDSEALGAAANVFQFKDKALSIKLYERCHRLEPDNPGWLQELSRLQADDARSAYELMEEALKGSSESERGSLLTKHVLNAFDAGEFTRAKEIAGELLGSVETEDWNAGNAHFKAHTVLGLLALENNNLKSAKHHLLESAKTEGSPQLNSFGPNMRLAQALLERGQQEVVLVFLESCREFWESSYPTEWTQSIKGGTIPDFGPNLHY